MTAVNSLHSLVLYTIQHVSSDRFQRAVNALAEGSIAVTLTRHSAAEIRALVKNGDGSEYGVTLTEALMTCSCKDALYRGVVCKHAVVVALHVLRTPSPKQEAPVAQEPRPTFHLMWRDGLVACGEPNPDRFWLYPWTDYMLTWPEACPACVAAYKQPKTAHAVAA
jgi:SWIM zinc finger